MASPAQSNATRHSSISSGSAYPNFDYRGYSVSHPHVYHNGNIPKLETSGLPLDFSGGFRTAPVYGNFDVGLGDMFMNHASTVNPAQLHYPDDSPHLFASDVPPSPFSHVLDPALEDNSWINVFDPVLVLGNNECVVDESSPSAMSTGSQSGVSEAVMDGSNGQTWPNSFPGGHATAIHPNLHQFAMDYSMPAYSDPQALR